MNLRDLHYFVVLAEVQHFGKAAKRCYVSQPTLSMQIKKLEEELNVDLFERNNKHVKLTDKGQLLVERAQAILADVTQMKELARTIIDPFVDELRLGVIPTLAPYLLPRILPDIQQTWPKLHIWLSEEKTEQLVEKLINGGLDAAIMATPVTGTFSQHHLFDEPFYFACAKTSPLANYHTISFDQLATISVMLLSEGHCLREQAMAICQMAKVNSYANFAATSLETLRLMVQAGLGVTLMPALATSGIGASNISIIPFEPPIPYRTIALYWRPNSAKVTCLTALAALITNRVYAHLTHLARELLP